MSKYKPENKYSTLRLILGDQLNAAHHRFRHKDADLPQLLTRLANEYNGDAIEYQRPDECRLAEQLKTFVSAIGKPVRQVESEHFLLPFTDIDDYFTPSKHQRMETFCRKMRVRFNVLMTGNNPEGDQWNFDTDNRNWITLTPIICND